MTNATPNVLLATLVIIIFATPEVTSIVGGHTSLPGAAPYVVAIKTTTASAFVCAGVLVKASWILTTAQCVTDRTAADLQVLSGSHRLLTNKKLNTVSTIQVHPSYNVSNGAYNVALLQLSESVALSTRVTTIDLNDQPVTSDTSVTFYGWGTVAYGSPGYSNSLQTLYRRTLSLGDCRTRSGLSNLSDGNICAISQVGQSACTHDEGGPLVRLDTLKLVGLYYYGTLCNGRWPDVFVDVYSHKTWIDQTAV
ncbi:chymotrypsin-1-like [Anopheles maculipalpis]|uniref:chymotrypsin-1-like n=1 Tax=Anopheles maculipalpis TaxID=1496333 RepID=UPI002159941C|nr:chymotrypsin-1-like [Anopheles maculipalpis]